MTKSFEMDMKSIILGGKSNELITNHILITNKHKIYKSKWNKTNVQSKEF